MSGPIEVEVLEPVIELQHRFADLHPALERCHPIAVVIEAAFHIYDLDENRRPLSLYPIQPSANADPGGCPGGFPTE